MHERAGTQALPEDLIDLDALLLAFTEIVPDSADPVQRVAFGTSGHRGTALNGSFNAAHIAAICTAIAEYRTEQGITGPLYLGADTHPLSKPAERIARETLIAAGVQVLASAGTGDSFFVPTPALSHAILVHNRDLSPDDADRADGIVITPSHNPPTDGGIKYNPPHGGPADTDATSWIARRANELLGAGVGAGAGACVENGAGADATLSGNTSDADLPSVSPADPLPPSPADPPSASPADLPSASAARGSIQTFDFLSNYVDSLDAIIDMPAIRESGIRIGAHPLGGASTGYWAAIRDRYNLNLTVLGPGVDPRWAFMHLDWDGKIRMDPSSANVMETVAMFRHDFDLVTGNDADADRHGIVTADAGLMNPNHFLAVAIDYLLTHRPDWPVTAGIGKTLVSSAIIDRIVAAHGRTLLEVPVGFKWFVSGLGDGSVVFGGEESAGASFQRFDGSAWSTDKDGIVLALLAAEIRAVTGRSPSERYRDLAERFGDPAYARTDAAATREQKAALAALSPEAVTDTQLAGDPIIRIESSAANGGPIGGIKVSTDVAWFAARPSGTEDVMKIYAESFRGPEHLALVQQAAQAVVTRALGAN